MSDTVIVVKVYMQSMWVLFCKKKGLTHAFGPFHTVNL